MLRSATFALVARLPLPGVARAQDMEPRAFSNAPVGLNFLIGAYAYTQGGLPTNGSLPITDPKLTTSSAVFAYGRVLDFWGKSAKFNAIIPYTQLSITGSRGTGGTRRLRRRWASMTRTSWSTSAPTGGPSSRRLAFRKR